MNLKRLWDTTTKQIVWAKGPNGKDCQVWTNDNGSKLYVYDNSKWNEYTPSPSNDGKVFGPTWKVVDGDDEVGFYDTNKATDLYTWESGDEASYRFMNGTTVLQSGKVDEGETPEYTGDTPTKPTDTHIYTFSGWKPTVGPIYKKTDFKAQFTATPVPTLVNSIDANSEHSADVLFSGELNDIYVSIDIDAETGEPYVSANPQGIFADERYTMQGVNIWADIFVSVMGVEKVQSMIEYATEFPENIFTAMETYYNNPTLENAQSLGNLLNNWNPEPLQNEVFSERTALIIFGDLDGNDYVAVYTETDPETGDNRVVVGPNGRFEDDFFIGTYGEENQNGWEYIFNEALVADDLVHLTMEGESATDGEWKSAIWSAFQTYYSTPTKANADAVIAAISATRDSDTGQLEPITWTIPEPTLLTYSELVALGTHEAILAELNTNDEGYYTSLTTEGHIYNQSEWGATIAGIAEVVGETQETTVPLIVDGGVFAYLVEGSTTPGFELHTWYWQGGSPEPEAN